MDYTKTLTAEEESLLTAKAVKEGTTLVELLDAKVGQYISEVFTQSGREVDVEINRRLALKTRDEKALLLRTL